MIKGKTSVLHPAFDVLSAHADLNSDGTRSRVGAHVARCAQCAEVVREIRELGTSTRAAVVDGAPPELWSRIEHAMTQEPMDAHPVIATVGVSRAKSKRVWVGLAMAAAAAIVAVLTWPTNRGLQASGVSRLTFSPSRPKAGGTMTVRYAPAPWFKEHPRLVLVGLSLAPADSGGASIWQGAELGDSIASLERQSDGNYVARVQLPSNFLGVRLAVSDSDGSEVDTDGHRLWSAIGGTRDGKPSFASFLAAVGGYPSVSGLPSSMTPRQVVDPADSLRRYFPEHPAGWAYSRRLGSKGSPIERLISFFQSGEKKYASFNEKLWPRRDLDAERMHDMVVFAQAIAEPGEVNRWARRFASEHPEDRRAFGDLLNALHQIELTEPPALADSIRPWFPVLDRIYERANVRVDDSDRLGAMLSRYADSATAAKWKARGLTSRSIWQNTAACARPPGKFQVGDLWLTICERERTLTFHARATESLQKGDPRAAKAFADSALMSRFFYGTCGGIYVAYFSRASAELSLGDTTGAFRDYVTAASFGERGSPVDSAKRRLGARFDSLRFKTAVDSASRDYQACRMKAQREGDLRKQRHQLPM